MQKNQRNQLHPEINAFMHQQMALLQHLLPQDARVGVVVLPATAKEEGTTLAQPYMDLETPVHVKFVIVVHGLKIEVPASGENIFEALITARELAVEHVSQIHNQLAGELDRAELIDELVKSRHLH